MKLAPVVVALALAACVPPQQNPGPATPTSGGYGYQNADPIETTPQEEAADDQLAHTEAAPSPSRRRSITINGAPLARVPAQTLAQLEATYHVTLPDGRYWYDPVNGGFGVWGQPAAALLPAGLDLGPRLPRNASNGNSGVFINNRELQVGEVQFLSLLVGVQWQRGRYYIDAYGNAGLEGGPVLVNLVQVAQQRAQAASGGGGGRQDVHVTTGFGENQTQFFSSADGSCKSFNSSKGTIFVGC